MLTEQMQLVGTEQRRELAWSLWWSAIAIAFTVTHSVAHKPVAKLSTRDATNRQSRSRLRLGSESAADMLPVVGFSTSDEPINAKFLVQFWRVGLGTLSNTQCTAYYSFALLVDARFVVRWVLSMTKLFELQATCAEVLQVSTAQCDQKFWQIYVVMSGSRDLLQHAPTYALIKQGALPAALPAITPALSGCCNLPCSHQNTMLHAPLHLAHWLSCKPSCCLTKCRAACTSTSCGSLARWGILSTRYLHTPSAPLSGTACNT